MPTYSPGSFTKNFAWNSSPPGLNRLHGAIRSGFGNRLQKVLRDEFRKQSGIRDRNIQLIPVNFFLHNTIDNYRNYVTADELVRQAIGNPHSRRFDQLALFSMHLGRVGHRVGVAGDSNGAAFANDFVRSRLWNAGGWESARLTEAEVEAAFSATVQAAPGSDTVHKCTTNYLFMFQMMGIREQRTQFINVRIEEWIGPGLFLAFDRYCADTLGAILPTRAKLLEMTESDELYKLMGTTQKYLESISPLIADEYLKLGGLNRVTNPASISESGVNILPSSASPPTHPGIIGSPMWSDEDAEDAALVLRRTQEVQAQVRSSQNVRELKGLYRNSCAFCGKQTIVGVDPHKDYSEAAHIKPVGQPHNGPDRKDNMIVLCPEHHLQFDRGLLRIKQAGGGFLIYSKIPGDPLDNSVLKLIRPHTVDPQFPNWHYNFWNT